MSRAGQVLDRETPHNLDAEEFFLGACISDETSSTAIDIGSRKHFSSESFYKPAHGLIWTALKKLSDQKNGQVDEILLADFMTKDGTLDEIGGYPAITLLTSRFLPEYKIEQWAQIVHEKWKLRQVIHACNLVREMAYTDSSLDSVIARFNREALEIIRQDSETLKFLGDIAPAAYKRLESVRTGKQNLLGISSGFKRYDELTNGFKPKEMIVLAARPSQGKTSLAQTFAYNVGSRKDSQSTALIFSIEMSADQLAERYLFSISEINSLQYFDNLVSKDRLQRFKEACHILKEVNIWIEERSDISIYDIRATARHMQSRLAQMKRPRLGLIIIDYIQLVSPEEGNRSSREEKISRISNGLKAMAKELDLPVVVLAQLNRESDKQKRNPRLSDIRESGSIEQDADVVCLLYKHNKTEKTILEIAKQRNGPIDSIELKFEKQLTRFKDPEQEKEEDSEQEEMSFREDEDEDEKPF